MSLDGVDPAEEYLGEAVDLAGKLVVAGFGLGARVLGQARGRLIFLDACTFFLIS